MPARKPPSESVLVRAAEARAAGGSWEAVAAQIQRSVHTVRMWPQLYPERWAAALHTAERTVINSAAAESVLVLRDLLRSKEDKVRVLAAWRLVSQRLDLFRLDQKTEAGASSEPSRLALLIDEFLKEYPDESLTQLDARLSGVPAIPPRDEDREATNRDPGRPQ